jgi:predicted acyltransferase
MREPTPAPSRLASLDQFRGYTVLGMFFVNFMGGFRCIPDIFKHHNTYCSYADTIMPHFFFAVGFAYRLTYLRRQSTEGSWAAISRALRRNLGLILFGIVFYHLGGRVNSWSELQALHWRDFLTRAFKGDPFETLVHIGVTALWILPVIGTRPSIRIAFSCFSGGLHLALSYWFNYAWVHADPRSIDGGPLGFLTWAIPMLAGSLAYDVVMRHGAVSAAARLLFWGAVLMVLGYTLSCLTILPLPGSPIPEEGYFRQAKLPFVHVQPSDSPPSLWTMNQRAGSISYLSFGAGLSLAVYALFVLLCDVDGLQIGLFRTLGSNALVGYVLHDMVIETVKPYAPEDSPLWYVLAAFAVFLAICYLFIRHLEKNKLYIRL